MKRIILGTALLIAASLVQAAETENPGAGNTDLLNIDARVRVDWQNTWQDGHTDDANSGFDGKYLMVRLDGRITDGLTYSWRQRFNKSAFDGSFWDATDWLTVDYSTGRFDFSAGKQIVAIGGWEYDRNPVDLYSTSVFWQNVACYQLGVSAGAQLTDSDHLLFQVGQSMFHTSERKNMYGYNLLWRARHGLWQPIWSVNLTEYAPGRYINYIELGNRIDFKPLALEFDFMNRYAHGQTFLFRDCSLIADLSWQVNPAWLIHGKVTYDVNHAGTEADLYVRPGTELTMAGGGLEFFPLRKKRTALRLHANCYYSWGKNANPGDIMQNKTTVLDFGLTWDLNLLNLK